MAWLKVVMLALPFLTELVKLIQTAIEQSKQGQLTANGEKKVNEFAAWGKVQKAIEKMNVDKTS